MLIRIHMHMSQGQKLPRPRDHCHASHIITPTPPLAFPGIRRHLSSQLRTNTQMREQLQRLYPGQKTTPLRQIMILGHFLCVVPIRIRMGQVQKKCPVPMATLTVASILYWPRLS